MAELGLKMGYGMLFFSTHKNRKPTTRRAYTPTEVLTYHDQLQYYAQHIVHNIISTAEINTFRHLVIVSIFLS